jgi:hypothetical protein
VLPAAPVGVEKGSHWLGEVGRLDRPLTVVRVPGFEQLDDPTTCARKPER